MLFEKGIELFESEQYELAVESFIESYGKEDNKEEIIDILYSCFINPNEQEFVNNYGMLDNELFPVCYDDLSIDFIPVSEDVFYLFDRKQKTFLGKIDLNEINQIEKSGEAEFESVFISGTWDLREIYKLLLEKNWHVAYLLIEENADKFYSFFKLPNLAHMLGNVVIFRNEEIMKIYFEEYSDIYLPKMLLSSDNERFYSIFNELHKNRIRNKNYQRDNIALTIGIPSYQRGERAWQCVNKILKCSYDSEIEIVVSNNGSDNSEYYDKIKNLNDSRVTYHEFYENQGFATNVYKVLDLAKGRFCVLCSDEDEMLIENLPQILKYLLNKDDFGFVQVSGIGNNMMKKSSVFADTRLQSVWFGLGCSYITGCCFNMREIRNNNVMNYVNKNRGNYFLEYYIHCVFAGYLGRYCKSAICDIVLFRAGEAEESTIEFESCKKESSKGLAPYMTVESRIKQEIACLELCNNWFTNKDEQLCFIAELYNEAIFLLSLAYDLFVDEFEINWRDICRQVYDVNIEICEKIFNGEELVILKKQINEILFNWIISDSIDENHRLPYKIANTIIKEVMQQNSYISWMDIEMIDNEVEELLHNVKLL